MDYATQHNWYKAIDKPETITELTHTALRAGEQEPGVAYALLRLAAERIERDYPFPDMPLATPIQGEEAE